MTDERWRRTKALFQAVVEQPGEERAPLRTAATGDGTALRREVESLDRQYPFQTLVGSFESRSRLNGPTRAETERSQ